MKLDKHIVDMFTELTKPADDVKMEKTCYGTISVVDGTRYVKLDGSDLLVPAASTVKTSHGDRVTVLMKNHSLTVTGNLTAPATDGEGGSSGEAGTAATIEVGTVTTGEAGSSASVTNSGTTSAAVFDFVIPRGDKGEKGEKGDTGTWDGTIPDHEHTVSDITDFPTSLPANGGNADTLGNIPASELERVRTAIIAGEAIGLQWTAMQAKKDDTIIRVQVDADYDRVLLFKSIDGGVTWTEIPLGNADTLDGKHADDFSQIINLGHTLTDTKNALGIQYQTTTYWCFNWTDYPAGMYDGQGMIIAAHYNSYGTTVGVDSIWCRQIFISPHPNTKIYQRILSGTDVGEWTSISDGGNADTLDGKHASDFALSTNPTIEGEIHLARSGNATMSPTLFAWEDTVRLRNMDTNAENTTYTELVITPNGIYTEAMQDGTYIGRTRINDGGNADTLDGKHADEFLYASGFAGQLAKLFSKPANDTELATVFSVAPDDATLDSLNPGIYVVNTSAARRSLKIPNEIVMGGPNGATPDNSQCVGGILIKLGSILGKPGFYVTVAGGAVDRPYTTSCAFFISNNGSIYRAIESIHQSVDHTGPHMYASWAWKAFVFDSFSDNDIYSIQSIKYINTDITLAPGSYYTMYAVKGMFALPYTSGTAYGPTKSFLLKPAGNSPDLCIVNTSSTKNLIIPAGRYLIHVK